MVSSGEISAEKVNLVPNADSLASQGTRGNGSTARTSSDLPASSSPSQPLQRASTTPLTSNRNRTPRSTSASPRPSREVSPVRPPLKPGTASTMKLSRSRKNSQDLSPSRVTSTSNISIPTVPSAAAIQRALSITGTPQLQSPATPDFSTELPRPQKSNKGYSSSGNSAGQAPLRLKSPPPSALSIRPSLHSPRKTEPLPPQTPSIVVERAVPSSVSSFEVGPEEDESLIRSGMRTPGRGIGGSNSLETVRESSLPATPAIGTTAAQTNGKSGDQNRPSTIEENPMEEALSKGDKTLAESGSESGGNKSTGNKNESKDRRKVTTAFATVKSPTVMPKRSQTQLTSRSKMNEGSVKNMTVETETVSSVPQVAVGGGAGERGLPGRTDTSTSLRLKQSNETIRPRKEKKKTTRKAPSINSGTASSKADIFEAKVADAVGQANSSDSDETFVYESNPPEPHSGRPSRFHSRTPSVTSTASQVDHYAGRVRQDGHHSIVGKKSMKFANNSYHINGHGEKGDHTFGSGHGNSGRLSSGNTSHHHHIGRHGRSVAGHVSLFDNESPFPNTSKPLRTTTSNTAHTSPRVASPRSPQTVRMSANTPKSHMPLIYDLEGEGADDERTPLISSMRASRNRNSRRPGTRQAGFNDQVTHGYYRRITGCILLGGLVGFLIAAVIVALIMSSKPLMDVQIKEIQNVLASEQEIMLDLKVYAINPNLVAIQVNNLDINVFAKSKHVGSNTLWRDNEQPTGSGEHRRMRQSSYSPRSQDLNRLSYTPKDYRIAEGVDEGTDPIQDPESDSQTMLLGRILDFDSPLIFDASPIRHQQLSSVGEVRLAKPGNGTEEGGSERWEKVLQNPFELIVRGVLRYSLPTSSRTQSASIKGSVKVLPEEGVGSTDDNIATTTSESSTGSSSLRTPRFRIGIP